MDVSGKLPPILPFPAARNSTPDADSAEVMPDPQAGTQDRVQISPQVRELRSSREAAAALPEIREDRVAVIRAQIEAGTYRVDAEKIADRMVAEALVNSRLKSS